jgi:hypothetical protein
MRLLRIFIAILLSVFSTVVMSYIALAASIGPWIETTLVLCSMFIFQMVMRKISTSEYVQSVGLTTAAGGIGGILATGLAFSLPTLYFLSPALFETWMKDPLFFVSMVTAFCFAAGSYGLIIAHILEERLLIKQQMKFPIGELVFNAIAAPGQLKKSLELAVGFCGTQLLLFSYKMSSLFEPSMMLFKRMSWSIITIPALVIPLDQLPMYLAVGFVTGHVIATPLIVGFLAKVLCLDPLFYIYTHTDNSFHTWIFSSFANSSLTPMEFTLAFCSGMVLYGSIMGFIDLFGSLYKGMKRLSTSIKNLKQLFSIENRFTTFAWLQSAMVLIATGLFLYYYKFTMIQQACLVTFSAICIYAMIVLVLRIGVVSSWGIFPTVRLVNLGTIMGNGIERLRYLIAHKANAQTPWMQLSFVIITNILFLSYCNFTMIQQLYLLVFSAICIYQMLIIAGRMGIIPLGRFATFVMVPGMFLFDFDLVQVTLVAAFVEVAGGVAGDVLFGRKLALLAKINHKRIVAYQWLGLIVCSLAVGVVFWLFIHNLGIGQESGLPATKAASRALLIAFKSFDWYVLGMGFLFGYLIKFVKVNPALLLGGILMPPSISLMLISGGLLTYLTKNRERYYPFLSGVSAGNSIWMLGEILYKVVR